MNVHFFVLQLKKTQLLFVQIFILLLLIFFSFLIIRLDQSQTERHFCMFLLVINLITIICEIFHDESSPRNENYVNKKKKSLRIKHWDRNAWHKKKCFRKDVIVCRIRLSFHLNVCECRRVFLGMGMLMGNIRKVHTGNMKHCEQKTKSD